MIGNLAVGNDRVKQNIRPVDSVRLSLVSEHKNSFANLSHELIGCFHLTSMRSLSSSL